MQRESKESKSEKGKRMKGKNVVKTSTVDIWSADRCWGTACVVACLLYRLLYQQQQHDLPTLSISACTCPPANKTPSKRGVEGAGVADQ